MLVGQYLPEFGTDLITALTGLEMDCKGGAASGVCLLLLLLRCYSPISLIASSLNGKAEARGGNRVSVGFNKGQCCH
jgi:hypothetical protein